MSLDSKQLRELRTTGAEVLDGAVRRFKAGLGTAQTIRHDDGTGATLVDLDLEDRIKVALEARTGYQTHGEENGGRDLRTGTSWVLDPIDGTANYSEAIPLTAISLALLEEGRPRVGLVWLPILGDTYQAVHGDPVEKNGAVMPQMTGASLHDVTVTLGSVRLNREREPHVSRYPLGYRMEVWKRIADRASRIRVLGCSALELAWASSGHTGAAINFGNKAWDNSAGALLVRQAGGEVSDLECGRWSLDSTSILAGRPGVIEELKQIIAGVGDPAGYPNH